MSRRGRQLLRLMAILQLLVPSSGLAAESSLDVYAVNYPLAYFAERIGGESVRVHFPAPPDVDPAFWKPTAETIGEFQKADLILLNGAGYARWVGQASLPRRSLVDTSRSFASGYISNDRGPLHQHGPSGEHAHGEVAFTTWLDPRLAIEQARSVEAALATRLPDQVEDLARRGAQLVADLEGFDRDLAAAFETLGERAYFASHPIYAYLASRYGLEIHSFVWEPDAEPGEAEWLDLDDARAGSDRGWMLWEAEPLSSTRTELERRNIRVIVFEAAGNRPADGDFLSSMRRNLEAIRSATGPDG